MGKIKIATWTFYFGEEDDKMMSAKKDGVPMRSIIRILTKHAYQLAKKYMKLIN